MPRLQNGQISDFVRTAMREGAAAEELLAAQAALDDVLDAIDRVVASRHLDTSGRRDMVKKTQAEA